MHVRGSYNGECLFFTASSPVFETQSRHVERGKKRLPLFVFSVKTATQPPWCCTLAAIVRSIGYESNKPARAPCRPQQGCSSVSRNQVRREVDDKSRPEKYQHPRPVNVQRPRTDWPRLQQKSCRLRSSLPESSLLLISTAQQSAVMQMELARGAARRWLGRASAPAQDIAVALGSGRR